MERSMKRLIVYGILLLSTVWMPVSAHIFAFSNHTNEELKIRIQFNGVLEPWYDMTLPSKEYKEFRFVAGEGPLDMSRKFGFCLQYIQVATPRITKKTVIDDDGNKTTVYAPLLDAEGKKQLFNPWRNVVVTWVKSEAYEKIVNAGKQFAQGLADIAAAAASVALGGVPMPEFKVGDMAGAIGTWAAYSFCATRHFDIIEDGDTSSMTEKSYKFLAEARG
jgi:hypothetical protein